MFESNGASAAAAEQRAIRRMRNMVERIAKIAKVAHETGIPLNAGAVHLKLESVLEEVDRVVR